MPRSDLAYHGTSFFQVSDTKGTGKATDEGVWTCPVQASLVLHMMSFIRCSCSVVCSMMIHNTGFNVDKCSAIFALDQLKCTCADTIMSN